MTKEELIAELAKHPELVPEGAPDTFLSHNESSKNAHFFFRPIADDLVLMSSVLNASNAQARATGLRILDFAQAQREKSVGPVTSKLSNLDSGYPGLDHLLALGPEVYTSPPVEDARYLIPVAVQCAAVNVCEFVGDEGLVEVRARIRFVRYTDVQRKVTPAANERHRFDNGVRSKQKFRGVTKQEYLEEYIQKLSKLGGVVQMENYERVGCIFSGKPGQDTIEVTLQRQTKAVSLTQSLKFLDVFLRRGEGPAHKEL